LSYAPQTFVLAIFQIWTSPQSFYICLLVPGLQTYITIPCWCVEMRTHQLLPWLVKRRESPHSFWINFLIIFENWGEIHIISN
jgi:hypothetical protein